MATLTNDIGTGETYTTPALWETNRVPANLVTDGNTYIGRCKGEAFGRISLQGHTTDATHYYELTAKDGAEHDGRAHEVSAAGNARIEFDGPNYPVVYILDEWVRLSWLEIKGPGDNGDKCVKVYGVAASTILIHHNIVHNNDANSDSAEQSGIQSTDADSTDLIYRNIVYGVGRAGIFPQQGAANSAVLCNTCYQCNHGNNSFYGGIRTADTDFEIKNNACFDNSQYDIKGVAGTLDYNATSDTTGDDEGANGIADLVTADQFVNATTTWADTDLLPKAGHGMTPGTTFSTATYPEIDVSIQGVTITGTWHIGAGEHVAAGGTSARRRRLLCA